MNAPWEKNANSFCHQEENRGQESSRYRRGLKGGHMPCKRRDWVEGSVCAYVCVGGLSMCVYGGVQEPARAGIMN